MIFIEIEVSFLIEQAWKEHEHSAAKISDKLQLMQCEHISIEPKFLIDVFQLVIWYNMTKLNHLQILLFNTCRFAFLIIINEWVTIEKLNEIPG